MKYSRVMIQVIRGNWALSETKTLCLQKWDLQGIIWTSFKLFFKNKLSGSGLNQLHSCAVFNNTIQKLFYLAVMCTVPLWCMWESCMGCGIVLWAQISSHSTGGLSIFDQCRPVCVCTAALHCLSPPIWSPEHSSGLQWTSLVWVSSCGAVVCNSFLFSFIFLNDGTIWMGRTMK